MLGMYLAATAGGNDENVVKFHGELQNVLPWYV